MERLAINSSNISKITCAIYSETGENTIFPQGLFLLSFEQFKSILYPSITIDISKTMKGFKAMERFLDYKYYRAKKVSLEETILEKNASIFLEMFFCKMTQKL